MASSDHIVFPTEAEAFVKELQEMGVATIGSERWSVQRERLEKLAMQAVVNVTNNTDEFIKTFLISYNKVIVVIHELLVVDVWKKRVFPLLFKQSVTPRTSFPTYLVLYHEASLVSLLEVILFYQEVCEYLDESVLDLIDYCHRKITELITLGMEEDDVSSSNDKTIHQELEEQQKSINFGIQMKCLSISHYITNHLRSFSLSVSTRLLNTHDFPCLLVNVIQMSPWSKTDSKGELMKYEDGKWREIDQSDRLKLTKLEGQVWLTLYHLLMDEHSQNKYDYTSYKKEHLLKLRGYLIEPVLEQVPYLTPLQRYLQQLSLMEPPAANTGLILEQVPVIYDRILKEGKDQWVEFAKKQSKLLLEPDPEDLKSQASRWVDSYKFDVLETLVDGPPKCALCTREACKRCSRCRSEWYCGRECQVKHWKKHKSSCDLLHQALQQQS